MSDPYQKFQRAVASFGKMSTHGTQGEYPDPFEEDDQEFLSGRNDPIGVPQNYAKLPIPIRSVLTVKQFLWLSDAEKERLVDDYCNPDPMEFGT